MAEMRAAIAAMILAPAAWAADPAPVLLAETAEYSEGPVFDASGALYFSHGRFVSRLGPDGRLAVWLEAQAPNGHKVLPNGEHLVCDMEARAVLRVSAEGRVLGAAADSSDGRPLRAPNDVTLAPEGGFYFTDPGGSRAAAIGTVHYTSPEGETWTAAGEMRVPNGLVLSPDGAALYVAETVPNRILVFDVQAPGRLAHRRVFAQLPGDTGADLGPDGLAVDAEGNVWVAHLGAGTILVLGPWGQVLRSIPVPNSDVSNLVFGGASGGELYFSGSVGHRSSTPGRVYRLTLAGIAGLR